MKIIVGEGSCGLAAGAGKIHRILEKYIGQNSEDISLGVAGCIGMCFLEPIIDLYTENGLLRLVKVNEDNIGGLLRYLSGSDESSLSDLLISAGDAEFLEKQTRIALRNCGLINPEHIEDYLAAGGYQAVVKAVSLPPEDVIAEIKMSGLAGRGGAGFPTWFKWEAARKSSGDEKYLICNADEGDPGAFMDRAVIEGDPHSLIEGMLVAAYAIGCSKAYVYVRAEYPLAVKRLQTALDQASAAGFVGKNISGSGFSCEIAIKQGAGAFVCGEETALIESIEGHRGMPRLKPPYPAQVGLWGKPSNINNVETFANVPWIIQNSGSAFAALGTAGSKGTKVFAITGKVKRGGLVEIPMGSTLGEVIMDIGGGIRDGKRWKAVQLGGPSGGCIPASMADTVIDYAALCATGAIMGSGGMVVMDESTCMVAMARFFLDFTAKESCGKCVHCRIGTKRLLEILDRIVAGQGRQGDIDLLENLSLEVKAGSLCGLGQSAPNPVLTTIRYFRDEYEAHIQEKRCPAHECKALISYRINPLACTGCTLCARKCPVSAITGKVKEAHTIDEQKCIKCDRCRQVCKFSAVEIF
ncbi:MAG TPA: NADH-quinone oxidoreductase subunit NuoF [Clostridiales bacterium]|nr:NADH-quinone oxidoreductase subunit NuoF [Clostridiales bacterium]HQH63720.1 NADH-quinone oxidoreductase subunit NuoF [Clostridiales bacterium]HQK73737.1 NADH-quinone oxidoreductase subunit NuoF [Clostridiales bacterium]